MTETVFVNGKGIGFSAGMTLADILSDMGFDLTRIAVEIDGEICPRAELPSRTPIDGNRIEVVSFVGGG